MPNLNRRKMLHAGLALSIPLTSQSLLAQEQSTAEKSSSKSGKSDKGPSVKVQYLEIVTPDVEALCKQYSAIHGVKFSKPMVGFGNARTAKLKSGGMIGIRGPMRASEKPVVRPYTLVPNLEKAVTAATAAGGKVAIPRMEIPGGNGSIAIVILGGIDCGFWETK